MDERTEPSAAFALRLSADLLTALVLEGVLPKPHAAKLVDDCLAELLRTHAALAPAMRDIAAALTAQIQLAAVDLDRRLGRELD